MLWAERCFPDLLVADVLALRTVTVAFPRNVIAFDFDVVAAVVGETGLENVVILAGLDHESIDVIGSGVASNVETGKVVA